MKNNCQIQTSHQRKPAISNDVKEIIDSLNSLSFDSTKKKMLLQKQNTQIYKKNMRLNSNNQASLGTILNNPEEMETKQTKNMNKTPL